MFANKEDVVKFNGIRTQWLAQKQIAQYETRKTNVKDI